MQFIDKENGTIYSYLNENILNFAIENKKVFALIENGRQVNFKTISTEQENADGEFGDLGFSEEVFVDDITNDEIKAFNSYINANFKDLAALYFASVDLPLDIKKEAKLSEIKNIFLNELENLSGGLEIDGIGVVNCGKQHLTNLQGLIKVLETTNEQTLGFKFYNNEIKDLSLEQLKTLELAMIKQGQDLYAKKWSLENAINKAKNLKELDKIAW